MKTSRTLMLLIVLIGLTGSLFAGGFALTGVGSRATAMGGAFRGISDDPSAMFWNPAGMAFMDENSIALGGTFILPTASWDPTNTSIAGLPGYSAKEYEAVKSLRSFPNVFLTMTKDTRIKYGLGLYVPYGLGTTWDVYEQPAAFAGFSDFPSEEMKSSIAVIDLHPSVAYQIMPNLSAGLGLSVFMGAIEIGKIGFSPTADPTLFLPITSDLAGAGLGFGANIGMMYKPTECLSIGLAGKLPSEVKMEGDVEAYTWIPPTTKVGGKSDIEATLNLPGEIGIGLAYKVNPNWTVSLDYAYTMWDTLEKVVVDLDDPITISPVPGAPQLSSTELIFDWENTSRISIGTEYYMGCSFLRAGFFMDETPIPEETQLPTLSDISTKYSSNLGWGRSFGNFTLDLNVQYIIFPEREIEATAATVNNLAGVYNSNSLSGNIGLAYKF